MGGEGEVMGELDDEIYQERKKIQMERKLAKMKRSVLCLLAFIAL